MTAVIGKKSILPWFIVLSILVFALVLFSGSCSTSNYNTTLTTATPTALISAKTLKGWVDAGLVNGTGYDRVIILDVNSFTNYGDGHVPGAYFVDSNDIYQTRLEGPSYDVNMVLEGSRMDALIQKYGIDGNTTIVFTGGSGSCPSNTASSILQVSRAYWMFRYWGFPQSRLKVLDGVNCAYGDAYDLSKDEPSAVRSTTFSVRQNRTLRKDLRASLSDMISVAKGEVPNALVIDLRGTTGSYAGTPGSTSGVFGSSGDYVAFEGRIKGAKAMDYTKLFDSENHYRFIPVADLIAQFTDPAVGLNSSKTAYVHCRTGVIAAAGFFALDGILGWPVVLYDASWSQWGQLGNLVPDVPSARPSNYVVSGLLATKPTKTLSNSAPYGEYVISGVTYTRGSVSAYAYPASSEIYDDVDNSGVTTHTAVFPGDSAPAIAANAVRIQKVVTDADEITSIVDLRVLRPNYVVSGVLATKPSPTSLTMSTPGGTYVIDGTTYTLAADTSYTYTSIRDTYDDIDATGTITHRVVSSGNTAPTIAPHTVRLQKVTTDADEITNVTDLRVAPSPNVGDSSPWKTDSLSENVIYNFENAKSVEILMYDGTTCSGTLSADGTKTLSTTNCSSPPNALSPSGNQVEEDDEKYMNTSGGGSSGGSGGNTGC